MLKDMVFAEKPGEAELKERLKSAREKLYNQQMKLKAYRVPVLVLVEGWGTAQPSLQKAGAGDYCL